MFFEGGLPDGATSPSAQVGLLPDEATPHRPSQACAVPDEASPSTAQGCKLPDEAILPPAHKCTMPDEAAPPSAQRCALPVEAVPPPAQTCALPDEAAPPPVLGCALPDEAIPRTGTAPCGPASGRSGRSHKASKWPRQRITLQSTLSESPHARRAPAPEPPSSVRLLSTLTPNPKTKPCRHSSSSPNNSNGFNSNLYPPSTLILTFSINFAQLMYMTGRPPFPMLSARCFGSSRSF
jgi:hypothetical protein